MKPKLLMICLLRSSAAALATHPRGSGVVGGVGRQRGLFSPFTRKQSSSSATLDNSDSSCSSSETTSTSLHQTSQNNIQDPLTSFDNSKPPLITSGHIAFRLARRTDVPQIANCNLATLPENYNANFYVNHMRTWPELTLVAEHIPEGYSVDDDDGGYSSSSDITPLREYISRRQRQQKEIVNDKPQKEIVGYVLGKVEERPINPQRQIFPPSQPVPLYDDEETLLQYTNGNFNGSQLPQQKTPTEKLGHITSLAVHSHARRLGIAASLLDQLHFHLKECHGAASVGLHVRISNKAAVALYCEEGYDVADIIPLYYGDGEDAYFMRKDLDTIVSEASPPQQVSQQQQQQNNKQKRQLRRGEKERNEWLNRDASRSGSFFDNRKSMRETLSDEEQGWMKNGSSSSNTNSQTATAGAARNGNSSPSLSGQFKRNFYTFFNGGEQRGQQQRSPRRQNKFILPPWETGPEGLCLPRYSRVNRAPSSVVEEGVPAAETKGRRGRGMSLKDLALNKRNDEEEDCIIGSYEEEEDDAMALDARVASGSV